MNKPIRTMAIFCMMLFAGLLLNTTYLQYVDAGSLNSRDDNKRVRDAEFSRERGAILTGGKAIAESRPVDDQYAYQRVYPQPFKYAHVTGFYSYIYGRAGIEQTENEILSGSDPRLFVDRVIDLLGDGQPKGGSVSLTIDPAAQDAAFEGLRALGDRVEAAAVAIDPATGKILALASSPSYDPNLLSSHDFGKIQQARKRLVQAENDPMTDRATQAVYPPGSTFKLVTAAAALSSGDFAPDSLVKGGRLLTFPAGQPLPNDNGSDCGGSQITLTRALEVSCNVAFGWLGLEVGEDALYEQATKFGFGDTQLTDLPGQARSRLPDTDLEPVFLAYSSIGQYEVAATPLQMAMVAAGIANGGTVMRPYIVDQVEAPNLTVLDKTSPEEYGEAVSPSVARDLTQMMVEVVDQGTGATAQISGIKVAGKTGTAQSQADRPPYAWFVSFAPADDPKVAVAVLVEDAGVARDAISGSGLAAPIAKAVMEAVIGP